MLLIKKEMFSAIPKFGRGKWAPTPMRVPPSAAGSEASAGQNKGRGAERRESACSATACQGMSSRSTDDKGVTVVALASSN
jgi:hypothetical protein